jgi:cell division protein FtsN
MVQLGAYGDLNEAKTAWQSVLKSHADVLGGESPSYTSVTTATGKWVRLRIGPFRSAGDAGQACDKIRTRKIDCLVARS